MILANQKPIVVIGYYQSSMTKEFSQEICKTHKAQVIEPEDFLKLNDKKKFQYIVSSWINLESRKHITTLIDELQLDLITVIHDSAVIANDPPAKVQPGTFIFDFCHVGLSSNIGRHCIISEYTLVGHYVKIGHGTITRPGVIIVEKSQVGNNCVLNVRSTLVNSVTVCDNVEISGCSTVTKDITQPGRYAGTPARRISDR
jgi:UDP-3-O-[3-hydroxymyristoyl] glucosamine N-acyltransferase